MKKLFINIAAFSLLILTIGVALSLFLPVDPYWGNNEYDWKLRRYKEDHYNTVLFGSSRIYRGFDPMVFDSAVNRAATFSRKTFNLASHGTWATETFYLYDAFLLDTTLSSGVNLALVEFQNIMSIQPRKLTSEKTVYYQDLDHYLFMCRFSYYEMLRDPKRIPSSIYSIGAFSLTTFLNLTNLKQISTKKDTSPPMRMANTTDRGYLGFKELNEVEVTDKHIRSLTDNIRQYKDTGTDRYNPVFYDRVMGLIERSNQRGIRLVFLLPPVRLTEGMMAVYNAIPDENRIAVVDPDEHDLLYNTENWIDPIHFNKLGTQYFTLSVGNQYLSGLKSNGTP